MNAGKAHTNRLYWIFGSVTGTTPGINLGGVHFPLNPDFWTNITIASPNNATLANTKAKLNASGTGQASFIIPKVTDTRAAGLHPNAV